ncbi:ABC transporter substrate-binding protein [Turicimonas muris]|uniref:ABC transporter substrate-binding protein n=1 Tax=Turicimonas muris TaxID=1796652 RepID=UPI00248C2B46|nr:ABC transporter substrate-binding protein [Turicimonas muris]
MKLKLVAILAGMSLMTSVFAAPKEINIAYVKAPFNLQNMVMKHNQMLEKEFAKDGIQIKWHDITSGAKQTQAMKIATGVAHPTSLFAVVGKPGPQMKIEDLKGKTVVGPKGTVLHQTLVAALDSKGMSQKDVNFINMDIPKGMTAMMAGKVDAALVAASGIIKANEGGAKTITTAEGLVQPNLVFTVSGKFAQENPEIVQRLVKVNREALKWINENKKEALEIGAKEHGITLSDAEKLAEGSHYYDVLTQKDIDELDKDQKFLKANGMIEKEVNVKDLILPSAVK